MNITEIIESESYRLAFTKELFSLCGELDADPEIGVLLNAAQVSAILKTIPDIAADVAIFHDIVEGVASEDPERKILVAKISEKGLMVYGHKISHFKYDIVIENDEPIVSHFVGLFGSMLPEGIRLQVETEKVGEGDKGYLKPIAVLMRDYKTAKGKPQTARLEFGILDTVKTLKVEYRDWVRLALDCGKDEDELIERGLMGEWSEPKLGSGSGNRINLVQLGEDAMNFGPRTYEVVGVQHIAKEDVKSGYAKVGFELVGPDGATISTWPEVVIALKKPRDRGGIQYSRIVDDALKCGAKYYFHVFGSKTKMRWDEDAREEVIYQDKNGNSWETIDAVLSPQADIHPRLLRKAPTPAVLPAQVASALPAMKSAAPVNQEMDFSDIPF